MDERYQFEIESQTELNVIESLEMTYGEILDSYEEHEHEITIFRDRERYNTKHKLNSTWGFFYTRPSKNWEEGVIFLGNIETIEDFFLSYRKLPIDEMKPFYAVNLFREHSKPLWEHSSNEGCQKTKINVLGKNENKIFLKISLMFTGEVFGEIGLKVNGIKIEKKEKESRVEIWYGKNITEKEINEIITTIKKEIGSMIRETLTHPHVSQKKSYHKDSYKKGNLKSFEDKPYGGISKNRYQRKG